MRARSCLLLSTAATVLCCSLAHAEEWKKDFSTSAQLILRVETNDADVQVSGWDGPNARARVVTEGYSIGPTGVRILDHQSGDQVELEVHVPEGLHIGWIHSRSVHVEISVPRQATLNLHTGDGNIRVEDVQGELHLNSGDGDIRVLKGAGPLKVETGDGNIRVQGQLKDLELRSGDGNIEAEASPGSKISSLWRLQTGDGNLSLRLPPEFAADLEAHTGDGRIRTDFPVSSMGEVREDRVRGKLNGGGPPLELQSGDGNIDLAKL
jgi:hypothetical protein